MKKLYLFILILINLIVLQGCKSSYDFDFQIPSIDEYIISEITFNDYIPSTFDDYESIDDELILVATQGNILIKNISYNNEWIFTSKNSYSGSGVIFHETENYYYALTNSHVVDKHRDYKYQVIEVWDYYDNKYSAFIYESSLSYELDLAVIVFSKQDAILTVMEILDGRTELGSGIIAIGNPLDQRNVVSSGQVIRYNKTRITDRYGETKTNEFLSIIHSASINSGSSGGMLLNYDLKVVGVNYASNHDIENPESFAVPSEMVVDYLESLISSNEA
ncbi:MAG: serine protease [Bacillota bacterium]